MNKSNTLFYIILNPNKIGEHYFNCVAPNPHQCLPCAVGCCGLCVEEFYRLWL